MGRGARWGLDVAQSRESCETGPGQSTGGPEHRDLSYKQYREAKRFPGRKEGYTGSSLGAWRED